jgi:hypothetical protein
MPLQKQIRDLMTMPARLWRRWVAFEEAFWAPCTGAIQSRVNPDEWARIFIKAVSVGGASWYAQMLETWHDPDFQTHVVVPFVAGTIAGYIEYRARKAQGATVPASRASHDMESTMQ